MKRTTIDLWVGIFVMIGICSMTFLALRVANLLPNDDEETYVLTANFTNIGGLKVKAPVRSAGVLVGRVTDIRLDRNSYLAIVTLAVNKNYQFSRDAGAEILTSGLLGEQYIGLSQGGDEEDLKSGERIMITSSAMVLEQLIGKFMTNLASSNDPTPAGHEAPKAAPDL